MIIIIIITINSIESKIILRYLHFKTFQIRQKLSAGSWCTAISGELSSSATPLILSLNDNDKSHHQESYPAAQKSLCNPSTQWHHQISRSRKFEIIKPTSGERRGYGAAQESLKLSQHQTSPPRKLSASSRKLSGDRESLPGSSRKFEVLRLPDDPCVRRARPPAKLLRLLTKEQYSGAQSCEMSKLLHREKFSNHILSIEKRVNHKILAPKLNKTNIMDMFGDQL